MRLAFALVATLIAGTAAAQLNQAIGDQDLLEPWIQARAAVLALPAGSPADPAARAQFAHQLDATEEELSGLRRELEEAAISIVARPEFAYDAAQRSFELSQRMIRVERGLDAMFAALAVADRPDVMAARDSIGRLRQILEERTRFERDVIAALGSGSKNAIQALAARWWTAGERVGDVADAVRGLQERAQ